MHMKLQNKVNQNVVSRLANVDVDQLLFFMLEWHISEDSAVCNHDIPGFIVAATSSDGD